MKYRSADTSKEQRMGVFIKFERLDTGNARLGSLKH